MNALTAALNHVPSAWAYAIVTVAVLAESILLIGLSSPPLPCC